MASRNQFPLLLLLERRDQPRLALLLRRHLFRRKSRILLKMVKIMRRVGATIKPKGTPSKPSEPKKRNESEVIVSQNRLVSKFTIFSNYCI